MASNRAGKPVANWRTRPGYLMRVVLFVLIREPEYQGKALVVGQFKKLCPDFQTLHKAHITDSAIYSRARATLRSDYEGKRPGFRAAVIEFEALARKIVAEGVPISADRLIELAGGAVTEALTPVPVMLPPVITPIVMPPPAVATIVPVPPIVGFETPPAINGNAPTAVSALLGHAPDGTEIRWNPTLLPNFGISLTGNTGYGKTQTLRTIVADFAATGMPITVIDLKDKDTAVALGLTEHDVYRHGLGFNPLSLIGDDRGEVRATNQAVDIARSFRRSFRLGDQQEVDLKTAIEVAYQRCGIDPGVRQPAAGLPAPPTFADDVIPVLNTMDGTGPLLNRISSLLDLELFGEAAGGFHQLMAGQVVFRMHDLPEGIKDTIGELLLMRLHSLMMKGEQPRVPTRLLVLDEAYRLASSTRLEGLAREGRSFGVCLVVASQYYGDLPANILACLDTKIFLKNTEAAHTRELVNALAGTTRGYTAERVRSEVGRLQKHQGLVKNSELEPHYRMVNLLPHFRRGLPAAAE
jgi:hypothetical protein